VRPRVSERSEPLIPLFNESPWLYRPYEMTITFPFNIPKGYINGHFVDGGSSPPNEVRVVRSGSEYMTWNYEPKVLSYMSSHYRTVCEIIYVNSDIPRMGMVYLTSRLHTIHHLV
jgi:hypothetical protein